MIDTKAIKAAAEKATPGEWLVADNGHIYSAALNLLAVAQHCRDKDANAKHIATANPAAVIALCDEIERLRADSARYQWLREQNADEPGKLGVFRYEQMGTCVSEFETVWVGADLDAVVDAAMEAK